MVWESAVPHKQMSIPSKGFWAKASLKSVIVSIVEAGHDWLTGHTGNEKRVFGLNYLTGVAYPSLLRTRMTHENMAQP